ncbi:MAG: HlyD family efflux transporter periplasmic adaptor subunit [Oscillospiraceae bacterium]
MESRWTSVIILVLSLFVLIFFVGQVFFAGGEKVVTETAFTYSMTEDVPFEGVFLRNETVVYSSGGGVLDYEHCDSSKVGKSSVIARRFRSEADIERRREIEKINEQITVLTDAQRLAGTDNNQLENISSQINERHSLILESLIDGDYAAAQEQETAILGVLSKREISRGDVASYEDKISSLRNRASELEAMLSGDVEDICAGGAGYFVSSVDGYEGRLGYDDADSISADRIEEILDKPKLKTDSAAVGKLISDYRWRVAAVIDSELLFGCYEGGEVTLRVGNDPTPMQAEIVSITDTGRGDGKAVYVFECATLTSSVVSGRTAQFKYIVNSYGGLRVSRSAIRYNDQEERGVYIVQGGKLVFRKIDVEYWGEDYIICAQNADDGYLKLYDKIVTEGKDLYDGKVVE